METKRDKSVAALLTLLIAALMAVMLAVVRLSAADVNAMQPPEADDEEVFFAAIDLPEPDPTPYQPSEQIDGEPASATEGDTGGLDDIDLGRSEAEPDVVAAETPKPDNQQVKKPEEPAQAAPVDNKEEELRKSRLNRLPGKSNFKETPTGETANGNSPSGNTQNGSNVNTDGLGLAGRKLERKSDPGYKAATELKGWIKVNITVNSTGEVTSAKVSATSGFGSEEDRIRKAFEDASLKLKYSADPTKTVQKGVITWTIEPKTK